MESINFIPTQWNKHTHTHTHTHTPLWSMHSRSHNSARAHAFPQVKSNQTKFHVFGSHLSKHKILYTMFTARETSICFSYVSHRFRSGVQGGVYNAAWRKRTKLFPGSEDAVCKLPGGNRVCLRAAPRRSTGDYSAWRLQVDISWSSVAWVWRLGAAKYATSLEASTPDGRDVVRGSPATTNVEGKAEEGGWKLKEQGEHAASSSQRTPLQDLLGARHQARCSKASTKEVSC